MQADRDPLPGIDRRHQLRELDDLGVRELRAG
jgi:hypothetical protein